MSTPAEAAVKFPALVIVCTDSDVIVPTTARFSGFRKERRVALRRRAGTRPPADEVPIEGRDAAAAIRNPLLAQIGQDDGHGSGLLTGDQRSHLGTG